MLRLRTPALLRAALVVLLLGGAYLALRPWTNCAFSLREWNLDMMRLCSFGTGDAKFDAPLRLWPYPVIAAVYLVAALMLMLSRRVHFDSPGRVGTADPVAESGTDTASN